MHDTMFEDVEQCIHPVQLLPTYFMGIDFKYQFEVLISIASLLLSMMNASNSFLVNFLPDGFIFCVRVLDTNNNKIEQF